jgi:hypothetical protein
MSLLLLQLMHSTAANAAADNWNGLSTAMLLLQVLLQQLCRRHPAGVLSPLLLLHLLTIQLQVAADVKHLQQRR